MGVIRPDEISSLIKSKISNTISKIIANRERYTVSIPLGTFFANSYTTGFGPDIKFKITQPFREVPIRFISESRN